MTRYEVLLSETAIKQLKALPSKSQERIKLALSELEEDPFRQRPKVDIKKLRDSGKDYYRQRIGEYRAIYVVEGQRVLVARIIPRSKGYKWLD